MNELERKPWQWQPGQSGNPKGRPLSSRHKIAERLIADIGAKWEQHGESVLDRLALTDPKAFAQISYGILPREAFLSVVDTRLPGGLDPADWGVLVQLIDAVRAALPDGANALPADLLTVVDDAVRGHFAKPIEAEISASAVS